MADEVLEQPKKKRGRPPKAKRHDPDETSIEGVVVRKDTVYGKDSSKHYAFVHKEDLAICRARGMVKTDRSDEGPKAAADEYTDGEIRVGDLVLMEMSKARHEAIQAAERAEFSRRFNVEKKTIQDHLNKHGGEFSVSGN